MSETKGDSAGIAMADGIVTFLHLMYNQNTSLRVLNALVKRLLECKQHFEKVIK